MASLAGNAKDLAQRSGIGKPRKVWLMMSWINKERKLEVLYEDGEWYCGWLTSFNFATVQVMEGAVLQ